MVLAQRPDYHVRTLPRPSLPARRARLYPTKRPNPPDLGYVKDMDRNRLVLHLDDDLSVVRIVAHELKKLGYQVISLQEPERLISVLLETNARVVLLDVDLPGTDGLQLLQRIKQHDGGIQVIMLTGMVSMTTLLQSMRWGAEACVFKPVTDFSRLAAHLAATFAKIDGWWRTLHELSVRRSPAAELAEASGFATVPSR